MIRRNSFDFKTNKQSHHIAWNSPRVNTRPVNWIEQAENCINVSCQTKRSIWLRWQCFFLLSKGFRLVVHWENYIFNYFQIVNQMELHLVQNSVCSRIQKRTRCPDIWDGAIFSSELISPRMQSRPPGLFPAAVREAGALRKRCFHFHFLSNWMGYDRGDSFLFKFNGIWSWWQFLSLFWTKLSSIWFKIERKTCLHDHIPFNLKGNRNIVFSVQWGPNWGPL